MLKNKLKLSFIIISSVMFCQNVYADGTYDIPSVPTQQKLTEKQDNEKPSANNADNSKLQGKIENLPPIPEVVINDGKYAAPNSLPNNNAYRSVSESYLGMTPDQIRDLRRMLDTRSKAASELPFKPKPVTGSVLVSLSPGSTPPVIRPFINTTTSFIVLDSTGQAWPVENFNIGNKAAFEVNRLDLSNEGSTFTINALDMYAHTNLTLKLKGLPTPVVIDLIAGQKERDERVEVRVLSRGPNAVLSSKSITPATDSVLLQVLDGVPPSNSKTLKVNGDYYSRAWMVGNEMIVRTSLKIISPASKSFVSSSDGTTVYIFPQSTQLIGLDKNNIINLSISGW